MDKFYVKRHVVFIRDSRPGDHVGWTQWTDGFESTEEAEAWIRKQPNRKDLRVGDIAWEIDDTIWEEVKDDKAQT